MRVDTSRQEVGEHRMGSSCSFPSAMRTHFPASGCSLSLGARMVRRGAELTELACSRSLYHE